MTEILCRWLNETVKLSKNIGIQFLFRLILVYVGFKFKFLNKEPQNFAADFSNGYYIGEILHKNGLQDDFDQFSQNK
jgi:hypothetical protein